MVSVSAIMAGFLVSLKRGQELEAIDHHTQTKVELNTAAMSDAYKEHLYIVQARGLYANYTMTMITTGTSLSVCSHCRT